MQLALKYIRKIWHFGLKRFCPVCNSHLRKFCTFGLKKRPDAQCPVCGMLERHRAIWLFLKGKTNFIDGCPKKMMHVAPEKEFEKTFRNINGIDYLSVDLYSPDVMEQVDITDIPYGEAEFDIIYCCHVLEHVSDDQKAMSEFYRVLKPGGWVLIFVPIDGDTTFEDTAVTDPKEREKLFGQSDHVRQYGTDVIEILRAAGFIVESFLPESYMSQEDISICAIGVATDKPLFYCRKPEK